MLRLSTLAFLLASYALAQNVLVTKSPIHYEANIIPSNLKLMNVENIKKTCTPLTLNNIQNNKYISKHYINSNVILCLQNVKLYKKNSVVFNFGSIEIEKKGKIIFENENLIKIKNENGKIDKIYKDGNK